MCWILCLAISLLNLSLAQAQVSVDSSQAPVIFDSENLVPIDEVVRYLDGVIGVEYVLSYQLGGPIYSRFGHSVLRLVNPSVPAEQNLVFSSVGKTGNDQGLPLIIKGLIGTYPFHWEVMTTERLWNLKSIGEDATLYRYALALKAEDLAAVKAQAREWLLHPEKMGNYAFFTRNCATLFLDLLKLSHLQITDSTIIPTRITQSLKQAGLAPYPPMVIPSRTTVWTPLAQELHVTTTDLLALKEISERDLEHLASNENMTRSLQQLLIARAANFTEKSRLLIQKSLHIEDRASRATLLGIAEFPAQFYQAPTTVEEFQKIRKSAARIFGASYRDNDLALLGEALKTENLTVREAFHFDSTRAFARETNPGSRRTLNYLEFYRDAFLQSREIEIYPVAEFPRHTRVRDLRLNYNTGIVYAAGALRNLPTAAAGSRTRARLPVKILQKDRRETDGLLAWVAPNGTSCAYEQDRNWRPTGRCEILLDLNGEKPRVVLAVQNPEGY